MMGETGPWEMAAMVGLAVVLTVAPILIIKWRTRGSWRVAATTTALPLVEETRIEASVPGGRIVAYEDDRPVNVGLDLEHQVVTSVLGIPEAPPPAHFVASTGGVMTGGPTFATGDAEFDAAVVVGSKDVEAGRTYLTPGRRKALLRFFAALPEGALSAGRIGRIRDGRMRAKELTRTIQAVKNALEDLSDA